MEGRREPKDRDSETVVRPSPGTRSADFAEPEDRGPAAYLAEFIGTFALVFFVTASIVLFLEPPVEPPPGSPPGTPVDQPFVDWAVIGLVHVFVLFMLIQTLAIVSGAHFNPAVTVAMTAIRQIKPIDAAIFVVVQLAGGVLGALVTYLFLKDEGEATEHGAVAISQRIDQDIFPAGFAAEALGTFFLVWAIVGVAVNPRGLRDWAGWAIGCTLGLVVFIMGPLTGAGVNPARAFGPALVSKSFEGFDTFVVAYVLGPVVGGLLAAAVYFYLFILPGRKGAGGMGPVG